MNITLTPDNVIAALEQAVEKKGADYIYTDEIEEGGYCYVENGVPSCIVGHVLISLGVDPLAFDALVLDSRIDAEFGQQSLNTSKFNHIAYRLPINVSEPLISALRSAQSSQDAGLPWGRAAAEAIDKIRAEVSDQKPREGK